MSLSRRAGDCSVAELEGPRRLARGLLFPQNRRGLAPLWRSFAGGRLGRGGGLRATSRLQRFAQTVRAGIPRTTGVRVPRRVARTPREGGSSGLFSRPEHMGAIFEEGPVRAD